MPSTNFILFFVATVLPILLWVYLPDPGPPDYENRHLKDPLGRLKTLEILPPKVLPPSFVSEPTAEFNWTRASITSLDPKPKPDVTAILLNYNRFQNVGALLGVLCSPLLDDTIERVIIWNNNVNASLNHYNFKHLSCPKLYIYDIPKNAQFLARYNACKNIATTPYCFVQDDDYLVRPEIVRALRARVTDHPIHLAPPSEYLSTALRTIGHEQNPIHTSFSWLGYGAIFPRQDAIDFLDLLKTHNVSKEDMAMADNYFSVLRNKVPEVWLENGFELEGGTPFTVGEEGEERNWKHINQAVDYLQKQLSSSSTHSFTRSVPDTSSELKVTRAPCVSSSCLIETNIQVLPPTTPSAEINMRALEIQRSSVLDPEVRSNFINHPLSSAVDGKPETSFISLMNARKDDYISLDVLRPFGSTWKDLEMVWLVDVPTAKNILPFVTLSLSADGVEWTPITHSTTPTCGEVARSARMQEYAISVPSNRKIKEWRYIKATAPKDSGTKWNIKEVWMRGVRV